MHFVRIVETDDDNLGMCIVHRLRKSTNLRMDAQFKGCSETFIDKASRPSLFFSTRSYRGEATTREDVVALPIELDWQDVGNLDERSPPETCPQ